MKVLNLFAGFANNTLQLDRYKYDIVHVENDRSRCTYLKEKFPLDIVWKDDAYKFIINNFQDYDFIWCSPPCQTHSRARIMQLSDRYKEKNFKLPDFRLYELIIFLQNFAKRSWIVENVIPYYKCIIKPTAQLGRHKIWSNFPIKSKSYPSDNIQDMDRKQRDKTNPDIFPYILKQLTQNKKLNFF